MDEATPTIEIAIPGLSVDDLDLRRVVVTYDRESDTLMLHFSGRGHPGVSVVIDDDLYVRLDRDRTRVLGLQIEGFLSRVAHERPELLDLLDVAELRGITLEQIARLRREIGHEQRARAAMGDLIARIPSSVGIAKAS